MNTKHILVLLFVLNSTILISQQSIESPRKIFNSDYMVFRIQPEDNLYPHLKIYDHKNLGISINLNFTHFNNFISDSTYLIDTVYFFEFDDRFMEYRRVFIYDDLVRIKSVTAEVLLNGEWLTHQLTKIQYNENGDVIQINFARYEEKSNSIIINYLYDNDGLLQSEVATEIIEDDSLLNRGWKKSYFYNERNLSKYTFEKIGKPNWYKSDSVKCNYNQDNLPIERTDFIPVIQGFDSVKFIWRYNNKQQLYEYYFLTFEGSDTLSNSYSKYEYNELSNILRIISIDKDEYDKFPSRNESFYYYNSSENLDSIYFLSYFLLEHSSDSLVSNGHMILTYNLKGYLIEYTKLSNYKDTLSSKRVIFQRDEFNNVTFAKEETLSQGIWKQGPSMRIVYKKR